jgi:hypothetical protein
MSDMVTTRTANIPSAQMALKMLENLYDQTVLAERKINALFGANTLLVAALALGGQITLTDLQENTDLFVVAGIVVRVFLLSTVAFSTLSALFALVPRIKTDVNPSLFFFGHIASKPNAEAFIDEFNELDDEARIRQILDQVYVNSIIVSAKYKWIRRAAFSLVAALLMWIMLQALNFLAV